MKPLPVAVVAAVILALLWWFWPRDKSHEQASADASKAMVAPTPAGAAAAASSSATAPAGTSTSSTSMQTAAPAPAPRIEAPLVATVYFDFDRSALRPGDAPALDAFVVKLKDRNYANVVVKGYADRIGEAPHNDTLSRKRAEAAVAYLTSKGVDAAKSHPEAKGESEPVTGDACKDLGPESANNAKLVDCLQKDRRVEVAVVN